MGPLISKQYRIRENIDAKETCDMCFLIHICIRSLPVVPPLFCLSTSGNILCQSYNATVFYFDNVSLLAHVFNQLFLPNESSISQATYRRMVLTICFQLFKKQTILWRWGWGLKKMKCMVMYRYPTCDMNFVHRKR